MLADVTVGTSSSSKKSMCRVHWSLVWRTGSYILLILFFLWTASTFKQNTCWSKSCISVLFTSRSLFYYFNSVITALTVSYQCAIHYYLKSTLNLSHCSSRIITFAHSVSYYPFPNGLLKVSPVVVPLFSFELPISLFLEFNTIKSYYFI